MGDMNKLCFQWILGYEEALIADCSFAVLFSILDCVFSIFSLSEAYPDS